MSTIIYLNGTIYTMDAAQPRAQAMAIDEQSGRLLAVGTNDEVQRVGGQHRELIDLRGKAVVPGFIDAHIHLLATAYRSQRVDARGERWLVRAGGYAPTSGLAAQVAGFGRPTAGQ